MSGNKKRQLADPEIFFENTFLYPHNAAGNGTEFVFVLQKRIKIPCCLYSVI